MYDIIVLGGGPAGYLAAERAGHAGLKTLLIEKRALGGVCLNEGCVPSKALLNSAKILDYAKHGDKYGVTTTGAAIDQKAVIARKDKVVKTLVAGIKAQLTYNMSFDATDILAFRAKVKKAKDAGLTEKLGLPDSITINDIILYVVSRVALSHKMCNAHYMDDHMVFFNTVNLGMAVDTPRGLMVPTIFNSDRLSIAEISRQAKDKAAACQKGTISPDQLKDGSITVTNLGSLGIESFTPVINPPQTAIIGVNCLTTKVRDVNGVAVPYPSMSLSLTADHRAVDGAPAARFLQDLTKALENFSLFLLK